MTKEDLKKLIDAGYVTVTFLMDSPELKDLEPADLVKLGYITDVAKGSEIITKAAEDDKDDKKDPVDPGKEPGGDESENPEDPKDPPVDPENPDDPKKDDPETPEVPETPKESEAPTEPGTEEGIVVDEE